MSVENRHCLAIAWSVLFLAKSKSHIESHICHITRNPDKSRCFSIPYKLPIAQAICPPLPPVITSLHHRIRRTSTFNDCHLFCFVPAPFPDRLP
ncbi:hypothetical protein J6590_073876 [Homalodisca vitripennis]|nr:hypothetical protein J6590_073876 [Homalodisca vitripennis]